MYTTTRRIGTTDHWKWPVSLRTSTARRAFSVTPLSFTPDCTEKQGEFARQRLTQTAELAPRSSGGLRMSLRSAGTRLALTLAVTTGALATAAPEARATNPSPDARAGVGMTYDVATRSVVLFGGGDLYGYLSDTWEWDSALWSQDSQIGLPTPRTDPGFAYDAPRHQVVMFGGQFCSEFGCNDLRDTWVWDATRWTRVRPATSPPARNDPAMEYDPVHRVVVLFGGSGLSDTWTWDGTTWTHQTPATS